MPRLLRLHPGLLQTDADGGTPPYYGLRPDGVAQAVTDSLAQVQRLCNKAMILDHGRLIAYGDIETIAPMYEEMIEGREDELPKKKKKKSTAKKR